MKQVSRSDILLEFKNLLGKRELEGPQFSARTGERTLLMSTTRRNIFVYLCLHPCSHFNSLCRALSLKPPNAKWHIKKLVDGGFVVLKKRGNTVVYMPEGMVADGDVGLLSFLNAGKNETLRKLEIISSTPGITGKDIVKKTGQSVQAGSRSLHELVKLGIVNGMRDGRHVRFYMSRKFPDRLLFYQKRERNFRTILVRKLKFDGLDPEVVRTSGGTAMVKISTGRGKEIAAFNLNPVRSAFYKSPVPEPAVRS
jgi:DNA-binding transcriptional ArsR family regulator